MEKSILKVALNSIAKLVEITKSKSNNLPIILEQSSKGHPLTITDDGEQIKINLVRILSI